MSDNITELRANLTALAAAQRSKKWASASAYMHNIKELVKELERRYQIALKDAGYDYEYLD